MTNIRDNKRVALRVSQVFGEFFVVKLTAGELLDIAYSEPLRRDGDKFVGNQRLINDSRRKEIQNYIESENCAFPNSIILAANFPEDGTGEVCDDEDRRWRVEHEDGVDYLVIPTLEKLAIIIDGQHRIFGFREAATRTRDTELVCSVYLDLPSSMQAFIFATINSTQKPVPKSQAYELFGYDLDNEDPESWSPDKLAISLCRKLSSDINSPFHNHVKSGALIDDREMPVNEWSVSTSCIVDCILRLISSNPKDDKSQLYRFGDKRRTRSKLGEARRDSTPLRELYVNSLDGVIYNIILNFFSVVEGLYGESFRHKTALSRTIGIQGLFDVLREYIRIEQKKGVRLQDIDFTKNAFRQILEGSAGFDFSADVFLKFSGVGRSRVRDAVLVAAELKSVEDITNDDMKEWLKTHIRGEASNEDKE